MLDHAYLTDIDTLSAVYFDTPFFGDHVLVILKLSLNPKVNEKTCTMKRCWQYYSSSKLNDILKPLIETTFYMPIICSLQAYWNLLENVMINASDFEAPLITSDLQKSNWNPNFIPPQNQNLNQLTKTIAGSKQVKVLISPFTVH